MATRVAEVVNWPSAGVRITALDVGANFCAVFEPLKFRVQFVVSEQQGVLAQARWEFKYLFDVVFEKREINIGRTSPFDFEPGENTLECSFAGPTRPEDLSNETLNNVACIVMTLVRSTGDIVVEAKLVMKVAESEDVGGVFTRSIFNPLLSS